MGFMANAAMFIAQPLVQVIMITTCLCKTCNRLTWPLIHQSAPIRLYSASPPSCTVVGNEHIIKIPGRGTKCQRDLKWLCFSCCVSGAQWPLLSPHGSSSLWSPDLGLIKHFLSADLRSALPLRSWWKQWVKGNWHLIANQHPYSAWFIACLWLATKGMHDNMKPESRLVRTKHRASHSIHTISYDLYMHLQEQGGHQMM